MEFFLNKQRLEFVIQEKVAVILKDQIINMKYTGLSKEFSEALSKADNMLSRSISKQMKSIEDNQAFAMLAVMNINKLDWVHLSHQVNRILHQDQIQDTVTPEYLHHLWLIYCQPKLLDASITRGEEQNLKKIISSFEEAEQDMEEWVLSLNENLQQELTTEIETSKVLIPEDFQRWVISHVKRLQQEKRTILMPEDVERFNEFISHRSSNFCEVECDLLMSFPNYSYHQLKMLYQNNTFGNFLDSRKEEPYIINDTHENHIPPESIEYSPPLTLERIYSRKEDAYIIDAVHEKNISPESIEYFPPLINRSANSIRTRYRRLLKEGIMEEYKSTRWSLQMDRKLLQMPHRISHDMDKEISQLFPSKSLKEIVHRKNFLMYHANHEQHNQNNSSLEDDSILDSLGSFRISDFRKYVLPKEKEDTESI